MSEFLGWPSERPPLRSAGNRSAVARTVAQLAHKVVAAAPGNAASSGEPTRMWTKSAS